MDQTATGQPRQCWPGAGRPSALSDDADKLLFVLVYLKTYPLQVVLGKLFGISTSQANYWLHHLLPIVRSALDDLGVLPERDGDELGGQPAEAGQSGLVIIDGTERRRQRPKKAEKQKLHYSGKKKAHTDKNALVVSGSSERVLFLSATYAGKVRGVTPRRCPWRTPPEACAGGRRGGRHSAPRAPRGAGGDNTGYGATSGPDCWASSRPQLIKWPATRHPPPTPWTTTARPHFHHA